MNRKFFLALFIFILCFSLLGLPVTGKVNAQQSSPEQVDSACGSDSSQVGCWQMEEGSGTQILDGSSYGNNGTTNGSPTWVPGYSGLALSLNGTNQYAIIPDSNSLDIGTNRITLSAWIKPTRSAAATQNIIKKTTGTNIANGFELSLASSGYVFARFNGAAANRIDSLTKYPVNGTAWMHIAATYDGSTLRMYINGVEDTTKAASFTIAANTTNLGIGAEPATTVINLFQGLIDDAHIYNRALSAAEIKALYNDTAPVGFTCTNLQSQAGTASTGEKPMSKVWQYDGKWWSVFPASSGVSESGSWLWRLDGTTWTPAYKLSADTNTKADVKPAGSPVGSVVHILLYKGTSADLASVQYNSGTYEAWSSRELLTSVSLPGSETATIDIDSTGRMWLNSQHDVTGSRDIIIYHSDSPYTSWTGPIIVASGTLIGDDTSLVTALPNDTIGVLWANENTHRFGFRYHIDTESDASVWSTEEQPTTQYGYDSGSGFADDHMNVAVASDGTLYAAIKTSYDTAGYPKIALIIRRLSGTSGAGAWDMNIYGVSETGTRGIVLLDEAAGVVTVIYTSVEGGGNILYKQSAIQPIVFGEVQTMRTGTNNDVSSTKQNINGQLVAIYSSGTTINGSYCTSVPSTGVDISITKTDNKTAALPGDASTYTIVVANGSASPVSGVTVADTFPAALTGVTWTCSAGVGSSCSASGSGNINETITLAASGSVTFTANGTISTSATGVINNTATVTPPAGVSDPNTANNTATDSTALRTGGTLCGSDLNLVACYELDEGSGNVYLDGVYNGAFNDGTTVGSPTWVPGILGSALNFNGTSQFGSTPDESSLDIINQITIAAWLKPGTIATQSVITKAANGGTNGYELSLASSSSTWPQKVFFRINQVTSFDTYRVNSATVYPIDGTWIHVAATYDGTTMRMYINGVENGTPTLASVSIATNNLPLSIGAENNSGAGTRWYQGTMDDVRVYNRALSATEVLALSNLPTAVNLANFMATSVPQSIELNWQSAQEIDLVGFNLYRAESLDGGQVKINPQLIPGINPGQLLGNDYGYTDTTAESGKSYYYWVEWIGSKTDELYGPVAVMLYRYFWLPSVWR